MERSWLRASAALLLAALAGCGRIGSEERPTPASGAEGQYRRVGSQVFFHDDEDTWGSLSRSTGPTVGDNVATVERKTEGYLLKLSDCESGVPLVAVGSSGRVFSAENVDCVTDNTAKGLGYTRWLYTSLRLDLDERAIKSRLCVTDVDKKTGCGQATDVFSPLEGGRSAGGAGGSDGTGNLVNFADSVRAWTLDKDRSMSWQCGKLPASGAGCDPGAINIRTQGQRGTVYQVKDGRYYVAGYDCYVPNPYDGEPIRCGQSFDGMADVGIPTAWIYKFSLSGVDLHFEAEMRGKDYKYYLIVDGPVLPL
jgi:hypothetical protein